MAPSPHIPTAEHLPGLKTEWHSPLTVGNISFADKNPPTTKENVYGRVYPLGCHASSCTAAVIGPSGRKLQHQVLETSAKALISFIRTNPKNRRLILEEGTRSNLLNCQCDALLELRKRAEK